MSQNQAATRIDALTGIRIVAAEAVFLSHDSIADHASPRVQTFMYAGYNGVTFFFILSGFVLAWNYADRLTPLRVRAVWSFFVARVARIYPLYLFALMWAAAPLLLNRQVESGIWLHIFGIQAWYSDLKISSGYNPPAWSISVEFFLYACFPLLILTLGRLRRSPRALVGVIVAVVGALALLVLWFVATGRADLPRGTPDGAHRWLYQMPLTRLGDFIVGICLAFLVRRARVPSWVGSLAQMTGAGLIIGLMLTRRLLFTA